METKESIAEEIVQESFNPDTSMCSIQDTRTVLIRIAAECVTAIEGLEDTCDPARKHCEIAGECNCTDSIENVKDTE